MKIQLNEIFFLFKYFKRYNNVKRCDKVGKGFGEKQTLIKKNRIKEEKGIEFYRLGDLTGDSNMKEVT